MESDAILAAVRRIYESTLEPSGWNDVLPAIAATLESQRANVVTVDKTTGVVSLTFASRGSATEIVSGDTPSASRTVLVSRYCGRGVGEVLLSSRCCSSKTIPPFGACRAIAQAMGGRSAIMTLLECEPQNDVFFSVSRAADEFDADTIGIMQALAPHLVIAWRIWLCMTGGRTSRPLGARLLRPKTLQSRYGLTPAEARLAIEIVRGNGRAAAARSCGVSMTTARTHLSRIFRKTGTHRQAELVRVMLSDG